MATSYGELQTGPSEGFNRWEVPVKMGILIGLISVILSTIGLMFVLPSSYIGYLILEKGVIFVVAIFLYYYTGVRQRAAMGGLISIKDAFSAIFIAILISSIITTIWGLIYARIIDPGVTELIKDGTLDLMRQRKVPEEVLDETAAKFDEQIGSSIKPGVLIYSFASSLIFSAIIGFICALAVKKAPKEVMR